MEEKKVTVSLPKSLIDRIKKRIKETEFSSVSEWITYVLEEVLTDIEKDEGKETHSKEEEERIKERLRALGYLE